MLGVVVVPAAGSVVSPLGLLAGGAAGDDDDDGRDLRVTATDGLPGVFQDGQDLADTW
jgi:hypothetical protein